MTSKDNLNELKRLAKQIARAKRIKLAVAQNDVSKELGYPHWPALTKAAREGWSLPEDQLNGIRSLLQNVNPNALHVQSGDTVMSRMLDHDQSGDVGQIGEHPYRVEIFLDDVRIYGKAWSILVPEAPSAKPVMEITDKRFKENPLHDPEFVSKALEIASAKAEQIRAQIAADWPRRSTKPDAEGRARHPISGNVAKEWFCLHCDEKISSEKIAANMWHCPECHASPIDIFSVPFWLDE